MRRLKRPWNFYDQADAILRSSNDALSDQELNALCWKGTLAGKASLVVKYGRRLIEHNSTDVKKGARLLALSVERNPKNIGFD